MKFSSSTLSVCLFLFFAYPALAETGVGGLDVFFLQQGNLLKAERTKANHVRVALAKQPFEIRFGTQDLGVCASTQLAVFDKANKATDTMTDYTSCMFLFKAFSMSADGGELIANIDGANWLNTAHGARKGKDGRNVYSVERFTGKETGDLALAKVQQPMYLAIWDDRNKNKTIDLSEVVRVELVFN
jgi:hypothetical protein